MHIIHLFKDRSRVDDRFVSVFYNIQGSDLSGSLSVASAFDDASFITSSRGIVPQKENEVVKGLLFNSSCECFVFVFGLDKSFVIKIGRISIDDCLDGRFSYKAEFGPNEFFRSAVSKNEYHLELRAGAAEIVEVTGVIEDGCFFEYEAWLYQKMDSDGVIDEIIKQHESTAPNDNG